MNRSRDPVLALLVVVLLGCTAAPTPSPSAVATSPAATASAAAATAAPSPAASASGFSPLGAIGQPADDGAAIVKVTTVNTRTRDLAIASPSVGVRSVRLLLPAHFESDSATRWPVLFLLHGAQDTHLGWTASTDVAKLVAPTNLLVVMPDGGDWGWYSDWWNHGSGGEPQWETFHLVELRQLLERNWRAGDKRAVAGLSMGGYGAMEYAARHPDLFVAAASFSGALDTYGAEAYTESSETWGDRTAQADVWHTHNPLDLAASLKGVRLFVAYGNGTAGPFDHGVVNSDDAESWIAGQNLSFVAKLKELKIPVTVDAYGPGTHTWPYWQRDLHKAMPIILQALGEAS
jgi:diacylglycerol O-acyltransferase / trehalose O-mycolyltransferase